MKTFSLLQLRSWLGMACLLVAFEPTFAQAPRAGRWDMYLPLTWQFGDGVAFDAPSTQLEYDDAFLWGVGIAYHLNNHIGFALDTQFGSGDFEIQGVDRDTGQPYVARDDNWFLTMRLNVEYQMFEGPITPVLTGGLGFHYVEMEVPNAPPVWVCVPDYYYPMWWCGWAQPIYDETDFTGNVGAGIRWDVTDNLFAKLMAGCTWVDVHDTDEWLHLFSVTLSIGGRF